MKPFYFGASARPLFGLHHPPQRRVRRRTGVVVCQPFGQEYMRAHRALRELAQEAGETGFHALRFDYFGTGDSSGHGDDVDLARWHDDLALAVEEMKETAAVSSVALVGLRLGATIAAEFAARRQDVATLVLWDPVIHGRSHLEELDATQRRWLADHPAVPATSDVDEVLGFPLPDRVRRSIGSIDLREYV